MRQAAHVLIVEDSEPVADAFRVLFEHMGRRVSVAPSVAAALKAIADERPQVVLLDLTLPDGDGLTVAKAVQESDDPARPVVVALTGHDDPLLRERCLEHGCADVLIKPVPAKELMRRVDAYIEQMGAAI